MLLRTFEIYIICLHTEVVQQLFAQAGSDHICDGDAGTMLLLTPKFVLASLGKGAVELSTMCRMVSGRGRLLFPVM